VRFKGPLANSYVGALLLVVCALTPYLVLSTALAPVRPLLGASVGLSPQAFELTSGMANAAYAFGTVAAVQLAVHLPIRRLLVAYASLLVVGSVLAAGAWTPGLFIAGHVLQGLCTSLLLIAAVPPLVVGWPAAKTRWSATTMNMCIFGAVALGPVVGGVQAGAHQWRPLLWIVAGVSAVALLLSVLTFEDQPPADRSAPWDWVAQMLAGTGCAVAFFGASELQTHRMLSVIVFVPLMVGVALLVALVAYEFRTREPLMPVRRVATTLPLAGIIVAMCAGSASIALMELVHAALHTSVPPAHAATLFWPQFGAALAVTAIFAAVFRTRWIPLLALAGLVSIAAAAAVVSGVARGPHALVTVGSGLLGLGVGAAVAPALFIAGFSQRSQLIQRVFALVELLRGVAAFLAAPIILHLAKTTGATPAAGTGIGVWVCFGIACFGALVAVYVWVLGRAPLRAPRIEQWLDGDEPALESPPLAAGIRAAGSFGRAATSGLADDA
jgi:MFS family permease